MALGRDIYHDFPDHPFRPVAPGPQRAAVAIVGAGPVGLTLAAGLAAQGVPHVLLEARASVSFGSRATCISRRSIEIWERFGVAGGTLAKGLGWTAGRSFWRDHDVLRFEMPNAPGDKHPPMVNIQQCYAEHFVLQDLATRPECDLRWHSTVRRATPGPSVVRLEVATPQGEYALDADWVVATDGARSSLRDAVGLKLEGDSYEGRYLIADIRLRSKHPTERRAWFDPASNPGSTVLMHRQPDDIWRIDYQLREDEDPEQEVQEERVRARISAHLAMIGEPPEYDLIWISLYRAHTLTLPRYRAGRVLFAGDAAHLVPIFGVRGLNSGIDDAGNLAWKLAAVVKGEGGEALLDSYSEERVYAAHENIRQSRKSTLFMTPPSNGFALMRDAALSLAVSHDFARPLVNPRQTTAITFPESRLQTPDDARWTAGPVPGATLPNLPLPGGGHLLDHLRHRPLLLLAPEEAPPPERAGLDR
uniref:FAD-dependent monooxygenase n=1 Tax=Falsiroseomonas oryzae TaxID=2766473 RepID=UPI0022EA4171